MTPQKEKVIRAADEVRRAFDLLFLQNERFRLRVAECIQSKTETCKGCNFCLLSKDLDIWLGPMPSELKKEIFQKIAYALGIQKFKEGLNGF